MIEVKWLAGRRAVVTHTATTFGREIVKKFAEHGAIVAFAAPDIASGERLLDEINAHSPDSFFAVCDLADKEAVAAFCAIVNERFPIVEILVNNPYSPVVKGLFETTDAEDSELFQIYQHSIVQTQRAFMGKMLERGNCAILNVSTNAVFQGNIGDLRRSTAAATVGGMTRVPVIEGGERNVRANELLVSYGVYEPEMPNAPLHTNGGRSDIASAVETALFLVSDMSSFVDGVALHVDGGARRAL